MRHQFIAVLAVPLFTMLGFMLALLFGAAAPLGMGLWVLMLGTVLIVLSMMAMQSLFRQKAGKYPLDPGLDKNVVAVRKRLSDRSAVGLYKYGRYTDDAKLTRRRWLRHLQDELLDGAVYVEAAIREEAANGNEGQGSVQKPVRDTGRFD